MLKRIVVQRPFLRFIRRPLTDEQIQKRFDREGVSFTQDGGPQWSEEHKRFLFDDVTEEEMKPLPPPPPEGPGWGKIFLQSFYATIIGIFIIWLVNPGMHSLVKEWIKEWVLPFLKKLGYKG